MASIKVSSRYSLICFPNRWLTGTWVPLERGLALAKQYKIETLLRPIIDFQPSVNSPPLAPKHITAEPVRVKRSNGEGATMATRGSRRNYRAPSSADSRVSSPSGSPDGPLSSSPSEASSSSRTPSPIAGSDYHSAGGDNIGSFIGHSVRKRKLMAPEPDSRTRRPNHIDASENDPARYGDIILEYFISDTNIIPSILINHPTDFDPNMALDDDGHTPLHWACAMGRTRTVKLLLTAGADIFRVNRQGQTALMRSVMFANNYDVRKFPELYELLHRSTLNIDNSNRTVFHHIVDVAMGKGKPHAARYYMETLLARLSDFPQELADIINFQDEDGETALTMAARCRSKRLVKLLIDHGADPKIRNRDGKTCEDYILEDERFRSSPVSRSLPLRSSHPTLQPRSYQSDIVRRASGRFVAEMTALFGNLASHYDRELSAKERDLTQARFVLESVHAETLESQKLVKTLKEKYATLEEKRRHFEKLQQGIITKLNDVYLLAWERLLHEDGVRTGFSGIPTNDDPMEASDALDASDLAQIEEYYRAPDSQTPEQIAAECETLRNDILHHYRCRGDTFKRYSEELAEAGTGSRMQDYRRLISAGLGGIPDSHVDDAVGILLEVSEAILTYSILQTPDVGVQMIMAEEAPKANVSSTADGEISL
jgi:transcription factor MBP1